MGQLRRRAFLERSSKGALAAATCLCLASGSLAFPGEGPEHGRDEAPVSSSTELLLPSFKSDHAVVTAAFRIAIGDLMGNIVPFQDGLLEGPMPVILAGLDYGTPWTRDASINAWNGASLIVPEVSRNTLLSVLERTDSGVRIGGQYWDAIVWTTGAWSHYLYTGDTGFLSLALAATRNSLAHFERTELDGESGLFRGPGWSDGVAAYPAAYADAGGSSAILDWPKHNPEKVSRPGYGIPMEALSTNCLYYNAYVVALRMARELRAPIDPEWSARAARLKRAINALLWNQEGGSYRFLIGPLGTCEHQEGLGAAYALLFGIAEGERAESVLRNQHVTPAGIPCGWPNLPRYERPDGESFGRHMGTVWPQIQGFWAEAAARAGRSDLFGHELFALAAHAVRDKHFAEIYHPTTGEIYGGLQESQGRGIVLWGATSRQSWAATAYLRMVFLGLAGMRVDVDGVRFQPCVPREISWVEIRNIRYRKAVIDVTIRGTGSKLKKLLIDGSEPPRPLIPATAEGRQEVTMVVGET